MENIFCIAASKLIARFLPNIMVANDKIDGGVALMRHDQATCNSQRPDFLRSKRLVRSNECVYDTAHVPARAQGHHQSGAIAGVYSADVGPAQR